MTSGLLLDQCVMWAVVSYGTIHVLRNHIFMPFSAPTPQKPSQCCQMELRWQFRDLIKCFKNLDYLKWEKINLKLSRRQCQDLSAKMATIQLRISQKVDLDSFQGID